MTWTVVFVSDQSAGVGTLIATFHAGQPDAFVYRQSISDLSAADVDQVVAVAIKAQQSSAVLTDASVALEEKLTQLFQVAFDKVAS